MLEWKRERDGEHNGKPCYEYHATGKDGAKYHIVWAYDHGGTFGYTAVASEGDETGNCYLTKRHGIHWARTLTACKFLCNEIENSIVVEHHRMLTKFATDNVRHSGKLVPNYVGEFTNFEDWCNRATRCLADKTCLTSECEMPVPAMCVDTKGRRCHQGGDFMRARDEGTFPVRYFWDCKLEN